MFMAMVDVPMYFTRYYEDRESADVPFLYFSDGVVDIMSCHEIVKEFGEWKEEVPWMTGYFSGCVWLSLWFAGGNMPLVDSQVVQKPKTA